jgi:hypothetical protein
MDGYHLFVSHATLMSRKSAFPAATVPGWGLDSKGFTEVQKNGRWTIKPREYVEAVIRYDSEIGRLDWAAPQDHMCEWEIIEGGQMNGKDCAGTRQYLDPPEAVARRGRPLTHDELILEHQRLTVANLPELERLWEEYRQQGKTNRESPFKPVLQGKPGDVASYLRCARMYEAAGIHLADYSLVGVGSVCRVQAEPVIRHLARGLARLNLPLHWFGLKLTGLPEVWPNIHSSDSGAWGAAARREPRMEGCTHIRIRGKYIGQPSTCANCPRRARKFGDQVTDLVAMLEARGWMDELPLWDDEELALEGDVA